MEKEKKSKKFDFWTLCVALLAGVGIIFTVAIVYFAFSESVRTYASSRDGSEDAFTIAMNSRRDYLVVVNEKNPYEFNVGYDRLIKKDLMWLPDCETGELTPVEKGAATAFLMLQRDLKEQGLEIGLYSAFRTEEDQEWVYNNYLKHQEEGDSDYTRLFPSKAAGLSEHHTGLLINFQIFYDYNGDGILEWGTETADRANIKAFKIIKETAPKYGFIERYPEGKEKITGYPFAPYELRFVGSSEVAHKITDKNLCLEEYVAKNKKDK